ncbi:MAG: GNAT family N-acetyltransferase [Acidimicrobiia bacterium]
MPRDRLGVALLLPRDVAGEVDGLRRALGDGTFRRIPPHLTLVPPVNVPSERLGDALALLRAAGAAVAHAAPLRLRLGPLMSFLPVNPVAYLAVGGDVDVLDVLRDRVFRPPLWRTLTHAFVPHVTVADELAPQRIEAAVSALADFRLDVSVGRVHLLREGPGRVWQPIADAPFATPAVVSRGGLPLELTISGRLDVQAWRLVDEVREGDSLPGGLLVAGGPRAPGEGDAGRSPGAGDRLAVTARRDGTVVGALAGRLLGPVAWLDVVAVAPGARQQGIGRHLLRAAEGIARRSGCAYMAATLAGDVRAPGADPAAVTALLEGAGWGPAARADAARVEGTQLWWRALRRA